MTQELRLNKTTLMTLSRSGSSAIVKDTQVSGLKFRTGPKRSVFQFEKRISGKKGSPVTVTIGSFPAVSIEEARQEARRMANLCERGVDPRPQKDVVTETQKILLADAIDRFFWEKRELAPLTLRKYRQVISNQFAPSWTRMDIREITPDMIVTQFFEARRTARERCFEMIKVFRTIWSTCSPLYKNAKGQRLLRVSPIPEARALLRHVRKDNPKQSVIPEYLLGKFVVIVEQLRGGDIPLVIGSPMPGSRITERLCDLTLLCLFTAFRFSEARYLKWDYVDLEQGTIVLPGRVDDPNSEFQGTKNRHNHVVPLSSYPWKLLLRLQENRNSLSPFVFPSVHKALKPIARYQAVFRRISELLGTHFSPHTTRRTFASVAHAAGMGRLTVKRLLNHFYKGGVTERYIVQGFNPAQDRVHFQKVGDFILCRRAEHLGEIQRTTGSFDRQRALQKLRCYALELGLDPLDAFRLLSAAPDKEVA